jgi:RimJ/RimL family protein N-acetyltransferase
MFIRTKRLLLRPWWPEDAQALPARIGDWEVAKNLATVPYPYRKADADYFIALQMEKGAANPVFAIVAVALRDQPIIGGIAIDQELGYWIARDHWRQGFAYEAASAVLELAFWGLRMPQMAASHSRDNPASGALLDKLGFTETGAGETWSEARQGMMQVRKLALARHSWEAQRRRCTAEPLAA